MSALTRTLASRLTLQQLRMSSSHRGRRTDPGPIQQAITQKLTDSLRPSHIEVTNDSHLHAGHAAMRAANASGGETHFSVEIVSAEFEGKKLIQRHRIVNGLLSEEFAAGLHALQIKAKTPVEVGDVPEAADSTSTEHAIAPPASNDAKVPAGP